MLMLGMEPFRINILTDIPGVSFEAAWSERSSVTLDGITVPLISKGNLIKNKRSVGRLQDLADVEALEAVDESS